VQLLSVSELIVCCLLVWSPKLSTAAPPPDTPCKLPAGLEEQLSAKYGNADVVTLSALEEDDRAFYTKDHDGACPGVAHVDFFGDHKPTLALVLKINKDTQKDAKLIVAHLLGGNWQLSLLETTHDGIPVVWSQPPGGYTDVYGTKELRANRPVIVFTRYESWSILYAWSGKEVHKIWLRD
jgi:hypothetical protein